ncbi:sugar phosphate isomerase/epimerase family protein [Phycicoccus flavus]|uniref:sugar phosphate isomerase/epimerase family protein n=1 Tax=Phycicoccus flavus TaxID=2502783 RepID=UPI00197BB6F7|nr:sugar phosphate isomerase/epimerase [Phycicoccus flavus]
MSTTADRIGMSTISFRFRPLPEALGLIASLGVVDIDLGAIPAVTDHVPVPFDGSVEAVVDLVAEHGLSVGSVNSDIGDLNDPGRRTGDLLATAEPLLRLAAGTGGALVVPCGAARYEPFMDVGSDLDLIATRLHALAARAEAHGVRLLVEVLHHRRFVHTVERADRVLDSIGPDVFGLVYDVSHVVASDEDEVAWARAVAPRVERVHLRDAVPGDLNRGIGRGRVDFAGTLGALEQAGYSGGYVLELETHDVAEEDRPADAARSRALVLDLLTANDDLSPTRSTT